MTRLLESLAVETFDAHPLHAVERDWTETNCYVDVWIEVLHALGLDPLAAGAFTLSADFEGDQWRFFKYPPEDLRAVYGIEVNELNVWKAVVDHVDEQLGLGRLCTVEADSYYLPDTREVAYRSAHVKTTIVPQFLDVDGGRLGYFHNAGYFELEGDDFDGVFTLGSHAGELVLPPYVESIRLDGIRSHDPDLVDRALGVTADHLARRPRDNPVLRLGERLGRDLEWLAGRDLETFHRYSFGTCRQCGATAEMAASFVDWLDEHGRSGSKEAAEAFRAVSSAAKALQFSLARVVRGRGIDLGAVIEPMAANWARAIDIMVSRYGG